ncbi:MULTISPECIES: transposase [Isoptericola]|uniref:transposase n=1 Tax=Isoptericola sp. CG 20/1183 TaxID=1881052 RepID=UPI002159AF5A|nr:MULTISPECIES: transposase [Isoptericola]
MSEVARLERTLSRWRQALPAYFTTDRANNGGPETTNSILELHGRLACGYRNRDNYRLPVALSAWASTSHLDGMSREPRKRQIAKIMVELICRYTTSATLRHKSTRLLFCMHRTLRQ